MALTHEEPKDPLDLFEESVRKLKIGFDLFFAGARKLPPTEERKRLEALIHELAAMKMRDNARRFRFNTLLGRYNQFRELWSRKMREREEGPMSFQRRRQATSDAEAAPLPKPEQTRSHRETSAPPESYVTVTASAGGAAIKELHQQIVAAQKQLGGSALSYEQVSSMVEKQAEALRQRYGVSKVAFRVDTSEGKVKLKAKPVQG
jgi:hypothetical protein